MYMKRGWGAQAGITSNGSGPNLFDAAASGTLGANEDNNQLDVVGENQEVKAFRPGQQQRPQTTHKPGVRRVNFQTIREGPVSKSRVSRSRMNQGLSSNNAMASLRGRADYNK
jgi:hypothetical protein